MLIPSFATFIANSITWADFVPARVTGSATALIDLLSGMAPFISELSAKAACVCACDLSVRKGFRVIGVSAAHRPSVNLASASEIRSWTAIRNTIWPSFSVSTSAVWSS